MRAILLATSLAATLPAVVAPASASPDIWGCGYIAFEDPTDPQGETWIEFTQSIFITPNASQWEVTCWLQTGETLLTTTGNCTTANTTAGDPCWTNPTPNGEIQNTRHTCSDVVGVGTCNNPVIFQTSVDEYYLCEHVRWTESTIVPGGDVVNHIIRDVFSTGGITTMGGTANIIATVQLAVNNAIATVTGGGGGTTQHTEWRDADPATPGVQCWPSDV